ncbi:MAG: phage terminase small subunit P27 family [Pseudomonadota bacterium]
MTDTPAPSWFTLAAREEWERVTPLLVERKILTKADLGILESYCMAIGQSRDMERALQRDGVIIKIYALDKQGAVVLDDEGRPVLSKMQKNPAVQVQKDAMNTARLLGAELGVSPVSRSRPTVGGDDDQDGLFDF